MLPENKKFLILNKENWLHRRSFPWVENELRVIIRYVILYLDSHFSFIPYSDDILWHENTHWSTRMSIILFDDIAISLMTKRVSPMELFTGINTKQ